MTHVWIKEIEMPAGAKIGSGYPQMTQPEVERAYQQLGISAETIALIDRAASYEEGCRILATLKLAARKRVAETPEPERARLAWFVRIYVEPLEAPRARASQR